MGVVIYVVGVLTGAGLMLLHHREVAKAVNT